MSTKETADDEQFNALLADEFDKPGTFIDENKLQAGDRASDAQGKDARTRVPSKRTERTAMKHASSRLDAKQSPKRPVDAAAKSPGQKRKQTTPGRGTSWKKKRSQVNRDDDDDDDDEEYVPSESDDTSESQPDTSESQNDADLQADEPVARRGKQRANRVQPTPVLPTAIESASVQAGSQHPGTKAVSKSPPVPQHGGPPPSGLSQVLAKALPHDMAVTTTAFTWPHQRGESKQTEQSTSPGRAGRKKKHLPSRKDAATTATKTDNRKRPNSRNTLTGKLGIGKKRAKQKRKALDPALNPKSPKLPKFETDMRKAMQLSKLESKRHRQRQQPTQEPVHNTDKDDKVNGENADADHADSDEDPEHTDDDDEQTAQAAPLVSTPVTSASEKVSLPAPIVPTSTSTSTSTSTNTRVDTSTNAPVMRSEWKVARASTPGRVLSLRLVEVAMCMATDPCSLRERNAILTYINDVILPCGRLAFVDSVGVDFVAMLHCDKSEKCFVCGVERDANETRKRVHFAHPQQLLPLAQYTVLRQMIPNAQAGEKAKQEWAWRCLSEFVVTMEASGDPRTLLLLKEAKQKRRLSKFVSCVIRQAIGYNGRSNDDLSPHLYCYEKGAVEWYPLTQNIRNLLCLLFHGVLDDEARFKACDSIEQYMNIVFARRLAAHGIKEKINEYDPAAQTRCCLSMFDDPDTCTRLMHSVYDIDLPFVSHILFLRGKEQVECRVKTLTNLFIPMELCGTWIQDPLIETRATQFPGELDELDAKHAPGASSVTPGGPGDAPASVATDAHSTVAPQPPRAAVRDSKDEKKEPTRIPVPPATAVPERGILKSSHPTVAAMIRDCLTVHGVPLAVSRICHEYYCRSVELESVTDMQTYRPNSPTLHPRPAGALSDAFAKKGYGNTRLNKDKQPVLVPEDYTECDIPTAERHLQNQLETIQRLEARQLQLIEEVKLYASMATSQDERHARAVQELTDEDIGSQPDKTGAMMNDTLDVHRQLETSREALQRIGPRIQKTIELAKKIGARIQELRSGPTSAVPAAANAAAVAVPVVPPNAASASVSAPATTNTSTSASEPTAMDIDLDRVFAD